MAKSKFHMPTAYTILLLLIIDLTSLPKRADHFDPKTLCLHTKDLIFLALLQIVENRFAPRRPTLIQRGILGSPAAGWAPRRCRVA